MLERAAAAGVPARVIGRTGGNGCGSRSTGASAIDVPVDEAERAWSAAIESYFAKKIAMSNADKFKDECGVFGIFGHPEAANMTYLGLYALQHRGQESAGIAASDGQQVARLAGHGLRRRRVRRATMLAALAGSDGHRPRALFDGRREPARRTRSRS